MSRYLDHEFENGVCELCAAAEGSIRKYQTPCAKAASRPVPAAEDPVSPGVASGHAPASSAFAATAQTSALSPAKTTRSCPFCAEEILAAARLCKHCKSKIEPADGGATTPSAAMVASTPAVTPKAAGSKADDSIFVSAGVRVTRARVSFSSGVDYPVAAISSVRLGTGVNPSRGLGVMAMLGGAFLGLVGLVLAVAASQDSSASPIFGVLLIVAAVVGIFFGAQLSNAPVPWVVFITTSGREQQVMSGDRKTMEEIVRAVRSAIDARG